MAATRTPVALDIRCKGRKLDQISHFKYLGSLIDSNCDITIEIKARLGAARSALSSLHQFWKHRSLNKSTKLRLLHALVWQIALYGCESWTLKKSNVSRLHAFEMTCYRRILKISWRDHRTNDSVLEEIGTTRIFVNIVKRRKLQFFGHVTRAGNLSTHILEGRIDGRRPRGRPKRRWMDDIKEWTGRSGAACTRTARDRRSWRDVVRSSTIPDPQQ